jgi:glycosyltransferase involved in cell wall biosynthesis
MRLWVWASPEKTFKSRMRFYLSYMGMAAFVGTLIKGRYDLVYATSPPLFAGAAGLAAATLRRIPFVFEVRDLWPESAVALGELSNSRAISAAEKLEQLLYRRATRVVAVTRGIQARLSERGLPESKLAFIPNGANTDHFRFDPAGRQAVRAELGLQDAFVAMYAGIHGIAQGLETLLQAAEILRDTPAVQFVFVGEGPKKAEIAQRAEVMRLPNVRFLPEIASASIPAYLSAADATIVPLRDEPVFRGALPSKMFEAWACARPTVLSVSGEAEQVLTEAGAGIAVPPEDPAALAGALLHLRNHPEQAQQMGQQGRSYVQAHYSRHSQARALESLLENVIRDT